ncbi:anthranilate synthase component 2 [Clostridium sp. DSM 8431]|uniref:anthranilate synthase component II n=1 Tax=Clostridium sp. DSM 8431 TaxID=1761781 RepID=UPI0008EE9A11|nr:aminodeoxychorismate/anthranilate synthase component II [Clostridium sp. DSM 8431]SFU55592.1 anthranilate synthase component 2 [Clostridium sp. DSM 8431]
MKVLLIDAFDSFVFVIAQYYQKTGAETKVIRVNENPLKVYKEWNPDLIVLGPGPGRPKEHGYLDIIEKVGEKQAIFGVCLGYQAIGEYFGWKLVNAPTVEHGKKSKIKHDSKGIFSNIVSPINVVRYHSLAIINEDKNNELITSAISESDGVIMAVRHKTRPIEGVQFHPESVGTEYGMQIIRNSLKLVNY